MRRPLTKVPNVGDVVYRSHGFNYFTKDKPYTVVALDREGDPYIFDDDGDRSFITAGHLDYYETEAAPIGYIAISSLDVNCNGMSEISLYVDAAGLATIREIAKKSESLRNLEEVERELERLQKRREEILKEAQE